MTAVSRLLIQSDGALPALCHRKTIVLAAGIAQYIDVPRGARTVFFKPTAIFYASYTPASAAQVSAAVPVASDLSGDGMDPAPTQANIEGVDKIGLISEDDCIVGLCFFSL